MSWPAHDPDADRWLERHFDRACPGWRERPRTWIAPEIAHRVLWRWQRALDLPAAPLPTASEVEALRAWLVALAVGGAVAQPEVLPLAARPALGSRLAAATVAAAFAEYTTDAGLEAPQGCRSADLEAGLLIRLLMPPARSVGCG